ncbi:substrate-binding domain-containing protein [Ruficoccus sp. ZRK36]|uniref:substrate-binding domain-containing protein n=1 Tax=Ruficoccus sp. ZRK36 TaxID=2866311 RepID=UPI001C7352CE|nr:substrate-binding domain-containing protein [Ruficoccus sp. ZRK36]QYY36917.1 helix-turn-helix domain-containing protein [Ruficoccus sp. ZRK36]
MDSLLVNNFIQKYRKELGWTQSDLARQAGLSRQLIHAVEGGRSKPGIEVALRLARALKCTVEELFPLPEEWQLQSWPGLEEGRCQLARVRDQWYAIPCGDAGSFDLADAVVEKTGTELHIQPMQPLGHLPDSVVICGCDPGLAIAARMAELESKGSARPLWRSVSSSESLRRLAAGQCHLAGVHYSGQSGSLNVEKVRAFGLPFEYDLIPFASWEQGIMVAAGNPRGIREVEDLLRDDIRFANREPGSAHYSMLEMLLAAKGRGVPAETPLTVRSHGAGAQLVASGVVDAALGLRAVARPYGLDFVPLLEGHFDLVLPRDLRSHNPVGTFLDTLASLPCRRQIAQLPGYATA